MKIQSIKTAYRDLLLSYGASGNPVIPLNNVYTYLPADYGGVERAIFMTTGSIFYDKSATGFSRKHVTIITTVVNKYDDPDFPNDINPEQAQIWTDEMFDLMQEIYTNDQVNKPYWDNIDLQDYAETFLNKNNSELYWYGMIPIRFIIFI